MRLGGFRESLIQYMNKALCQGFHSSIHSFMSQTSCIVLDGGGTTIMKTASHYSQEAHLQRQKTRATQIM